MHEKLEVLWYILMHYRYNFRSRNFNPCYIFCVMSAKFKRKKKNTTFIL
jgi:hypothetical protein